MSIPNFEPRSDYIGTGIVSDYSFNFKITDKSQMKVVKTDDTNTVVWEVTGDDLNYFTVSFNDDYGGQVSLIDPLELDYNLYIYLDAKEPVQTKELKNRKYYDLAQIEAAIDLLALQVQAVAYIAKRAPILGKLVTQNLADAFNMDIELIAEAVITINSTGDGFEAVPRSTFTGEVGPAGPAGATGANGADGVGVLRSDTENMISGSTSHTVTFSTPTGDTNYVIGQPAFENLVDADPIMLQGMVTAKTVNGFTIKFNTALDSNNYSVGYAIYDAI